MAIDEYDYRPKKLLKHFKNALTNPANKELISKLVQRVADLDAQMLKLKPGL